MKALERAATIGKRSLMLLILISLTLSLSACTSRHLCKQPNVTPWMLESQPLNIELTEPLFETLSGLQLEQSSSTESAAID